MTETNVDDASTTMTLAPQNGVPALMHEPAPRYGLSKSPLSLDQTLKVAEWIGKSGLVRDCRDGYKVLAKIIMGAEFGLGIGASLMQLDIVEGRPCFEYPSILAFIRQSGKYDYEITELTDTAATVVIYRLENGKRMKVGESRFTDEDAERAKLTSKKGPGGGGDNTHTRYPRNMRLARAVSNALKWYCSDVVYGIPIYAKDEIREMRDDDIEVQTEVVEPKPEPRTRRKRAEVLEAPAATPASGTTETVNTETGEITEAPKTVFEKRAEEAAKETHKEAPKTETQAPTETKAEAPTNTFEEAAQDSSGLPAELAAEVKAAAADDEISNGFFKRFHTWLLGIATGESENKKKKWAMAQWEAAGVTPGGKKPTGKTLNLIIQAIGVEKAAAKN